MAKLPAPKAPGLVKGLGVTLKTMAARCSRPGHQDAHPRPVQGRGHGAVPPREGDAAARSRRHRPQGGQLHRLHAVRPQLPRLVHLHRGPQGHRAAARPGGKPRTVNKLDRFDIDYALCMYCGICVEVCPFDALFWSPEYEYSELRLADLLHDKDRLGEWMQAVPDFEAYEAGSEQKVRKVPR